MDLPQTLLAANLMDRPGRELDRNFVSGGDGLSLAWAGSGAGPPVVLLHGTLTTLEDMTAGLARWLTPRRRIIAFDRPGFGRSTLRRFLDAGIWRQADRIHHAISALGLERPTVVGHSFGASVALAMAVSRPERLAGVVALAPVVLPEARLEHAIFGPRSTPVGGDLLSRGATAAGDRSLFPLLWRAMFLPQTMPRVVETDFPFALAGQAGASVRVGEDAMAAPSDLIRLLAQAPACTAPVRIMGGDRDIVVRNGVNGRLLAALMPNATYIDLPGMGHMIHHFAGERIAAEIDALAAL